MANQYGLKDIDPEVYEREFSRPIHRVGSITCLLVALAMFLPSIWLYLQYGVFPPLKAILAGMALALTYAAPFFIIEPISYYPTLGDAGTYMSFLTGNIANMRLPCAAVAQSVAGVEEGTKKGELIATVGIAVSIWLSIVAVFVGAVTTGWIVAHAAEVTEWIYAHFPESVQAPQAHDGGRAGWIIRFLESAPDAFKRFLLPAVFGAVFGQFALRGFRYAPVALILTLVPLYFKWPGYVAIPLAVFGTILFGRAIYRPGKTQAPEGEGRP